MSSRRAVAAAACAAAVTVAARVTGLGDAVMAVM